MSTACTTLNKYSYESGRLAPGDARLFRPGGLELTDRAITFAALDTGARVLDLGCGAGETVQYLRLLGIDAMGVDTSGEAVTSGPDADARIVARAEALPFGPATFDGVLAECSLSLFANRDRALAECARVLVDGGRLILSDLYARQPEAIAEVRTLHGSCAAGMLVREELEAGLSNAGFTLDVWEDHSPALRECAARFLFEHGSLDGLWGCEGGESAQTIQSAMRAARAGYFLLIATKRDTAAEGR